MIIVYCSVPDEVVARRISRALVSEGLCACVSQIPRLTSYYIYAGEFCEDEELMLLIKTDEPMFERLEVRIKELHPYELPEIIAVPISHASDEYATWLKDALK